MAGKRHNQWKKRLTGKKYTTVLFDADNTLFDFDAAEDQALRRTMEERGIPFTAEKKQAYLAINRPLWDAQFRGEVAQDWLVVERFRRFAGYCGSEADPEEWNREYLEKLGECPDLLPGALELVKKLKPHCKIALATNGITTVQKKRLAGNPITPWFDGVFISQEMGVGKPEAAYFRRILDTLGAEEDTAIMVGDNLLSDIQGAINAGLDNIWYSPKGKESRKPTYTVTRLMDIPKIVLGRMR